MKKRGDSVRRIYSDDFRAKVVKLANEVGPTRAALEHDLNPTMVGKWKRKAAAKPAQQSLPFGEKASWHDVASKVKENRAWHSCPGCADLRQENGSLSIENKRLSSEVFELREEDAAIFTALRAVVGRWMRQASEKR